MMRRLRYTAVLAVVSLVGCGVSRDEGVISSTQIVLSDANSALETMTTSLDEFVKAKEKKDDTVAKDQKETLLKSAESLKKSADKLQELYRQADASKLKTPEERTAFRERNKAKLAKVADTINSLAESDRKFKAALEEATKKYDKDLTDVLKKLQEANLQFSSLKPSTAVRAR
jgi:hypothetical protein